MASACAFAFLFVFTGGMPNAYAAITVSAPPIDAVFMDTTAGGGALMPLAQFKLTGDGATTLTNVKVAIYSTTTPNNLNTGEVNKLFLYKESGTHAGFQPNEDILLNTGANAVTDPATSTMITLTVDTAQNAVATAPTDYFLVAKATTSAAIVNGHALYATTTTGWITTSAGAIGNAFVAQKKFILQQSANIKISEVKAGSTNNTGDEFVELYNASDVAVDLSALPLNMYIFDANGGVGAGAKPLTYFQSIIPKNGFFLLASQTNYSGSTPPDAVYTTLSGNTLGSNGGLSIATSSAAVNATSSAIDRIGWGNQPLANAEGTRPADLANDQSLERKAVSGSTNTTMAPGGIDSTKGNSYDTNNNANDFVLQTGSGIFPQNTASPAEFPFGGGGQDTQNPQVMGSFPGPNQTNVPIDMPFIGFGFNKMVATSTIISATATSTVTLTTGGGPNLCVSVAYNPFPSNYEPPAKCVLPFQSDPNAKLSPSTVYTFTVTSDVQDFSGNHLDQDQFTAGSQSYQITFTTGSATQSMTDSIPPNVVGTSPFPGSMNVPTNIAKMFVKFSQSAMDATTMNQSTITLTNSAGTPVSLSGFFYSATTSTLSFVPASLSASTMYTLTVLPSVKNNNGIFMPAPYVSVFTTGAGADVTAPAVVGVVPVPGSTLPLNAVDFVFVTDDDLDATTATSGAVTLSVGGNNLPGVVSYDPTAKEGHFTATNVLPANLNNALTLTLVAGALKNVSGIPIAAKTYGWSTETTNSDVTGPSISFANADQFSIAITFNEAVKQTDAANLANYTLSVASNPITLSSLAGHTISYDVSKRTAKISGVFLQPGATFQVTVSNVFDISGNPMSGSASFSGTVLSPQQSGGILGPGDSSGNFGPQINNFTSSGIGFMPGMRVMPMNSFISATTTYGFEMPISKRIPANGKIVITFPASSDFGVCCALYTSTDNPFITSQNADINGPGDGTVGFSAIASNLSAKNISLTLNTATQQTSGGDTHDFLRFAVTGVKNPSIPKGMDSSGYSLDIKTISDTGALLESFTSSPVYITGGAIDGSATTTITGTVSGNGGNLGGVTIRMMSPQTGMVSTNTDNSGVYSFTNVPVNKQIANFGNTGTEYDLSTDPIVLPTSTTTAFFGEPMPTPVHATSTDVVIQNYSLTATTSALTLTVKLTGDNSANAIFSAGEKMDVFAGGPGKFFVQTITTSATNYSGTVIATLPFPAATASNGSWGVGVGPAMPKGMGGMQFGPPPAPNWVVPKPVEVVISGCPAACAAAINNSSASSYTFTVSATNRAITGVLKDGSGNAISGAQVYAFSPTLGIGNQTQTSPTGAFTVKVTDGSFNVGAAVPGVGRSREVPVVVNGNGVFVDGSAIASTGSSGAAPFTLTIKKSSYTITGRVSDGSNIISNAPVFAYRTDAPGHIDAMTSSDGTYTLYVDTGSWKVGSFIPGFGPMPEQTVTITASSQSNINFSPSTATTFNMISGTVFESADAVIDSGEGISGVVVRVSGANGTNETITGSDGTYSLRVPSGSYSFTDIFKPGYGKIAPLNENLAAITTIDATSDVTKNIRVKTRDTVTVTIKDSNGNALTVSKAYIDLFDATKNLGNHAEITNGASTTIQIADGASTTIRAFIQGVPPANISVASDDAVNTRVLGGVLEVNGPEKIKIVVNTATAAMTTILGTVYAGTATAGNEVANAWVQFVDPTNNVLFGTQATSSGAYSIQLANGTYQVQAMKPGFIGVPVSMTVSVATTTANVLVTQAALSISGTVTAGGSAATDAYVWAEKAGGGFSSTKTSSSGAFTLSVDSGQWRVFAAADGYQKSAYGLNPVSAGATGIAITLSSTASISSKTTTSNSFSDTSVGTLSDNTVGVGVSLDSGALGSAGNTAYLSAKQTSNIPQSTDTNIVASRAVDISATAGSSAVTNLQSGKKAEVTLNYTKADLATAGITTTTEVGTLKVSSWSDDKKAWESLTTVATYKDSNGAAVASPTANLSNVSSIDFITEEATHFSAYALGAASNPGAPATPSGLGVTQSTTALTANLTWTANTEASLTGYYLYRDSGAGTYPLLANLGTVTSYTDANLIGGTTYSYKLSAYDNAGNESAASNAQSITIHGIDAGGGTVGGSGGGGVGGGTGTTALPATAPSAAPVPAAVQPLSAGSGTVLSTVSSLLTKDIEIGARSDAVKHLQEILKQDKTIYPEGIVNGIFGPATTRAVKRFQKKYGLPAVGRVGKATRSKLQEVFQTLATPSITPVPQTASPTAQSASAAVSPVFNKNLAI
ncbi:Ig-like domain-containing protein, partial [Patescibacteria group bacterium]|nr:Ig-like domain-containing protein [Patescibacteria group bacterium]